MKKIYKIFKKIFKSNLPKDVLFKDQYGNYVTRDGFRSSKSVEELIKIERDLIAKGDPILNNVRN